MCGYTPVPEDGRTCYQIRLQHLNVAVTDGVRISQPVGINCHVTQSAVYLCHI